MCIHERITYKYTVLIVLKQFLFLEQDTTHPVYGGRHLATVELTYVFMTLGTEIVSPILMHSQVEFRSMLDYSLVKR
jgi:hypothetical protein